MTSLRRRARRTRSPTWSTRLDARRAACLAWLVELVAGEVVDEVDGLVENTSSRLHEHAELASAPVPSSSRAEVLDGLGVLVDPLDRVGLEGELALDGDAADEDDEAGDGERRPRPQWAGRRASPRAGRGSPARKSLAWVGDLYSRMPRVASGSRMLARQMTAMPTASSSAELADHRHLGEVAGPEGEDGVEGDDEQRRAQVAGGLLDGVPAWSMITSSSTRRASGSRSRCRCRA